MGKFVGLDGVECSPQSFQRDVLIRAYGLQSMDKLILGAFLIYKMHDEDSISRFIRAASVLAQDELNQVFTGIDILFRNDKELYQNLFNRLVRDFGIHLQAAIGDMR